MDLTGGLGSEPIDIKALRAEAMADAEKEAAAASSQETDGSVAGRSTGLSDSSRGQQIKALPTPIVTKQASVDLNDWTNVTAKPEDEIVIVSVGELGPWGSGRTRAQAELGIHSDGTVDLSAGAVLELAWNMGLLTWADSPKPGWYDTDGNLVPEEDIAERYHDEVVARSGIRPFEEGMGNDYKDGADEEEAEVFLDHDVTFSVPTREVATEYVKLDEAHTTIAPDEESGEWNVTRHAGSMIRVPRRATMTRTVGGQFPKGFDRPMGHSRLDGRRRRQDRPVEHRHHCGRLPGAGFTPAEIPRVHPPLAGGFDPGHRLRRHDVDAQAVPRPLPQPRDPDRHPAGSPAERGRGSRDAVLHRRLRQHDPARLRLRHRSRLP
mgnify:CR=1 FL=1